MYKSTVWDTTISSGRLHHRLQGRRGPPEDEEGHSAVEGLKAQSLDQPKRFRSTRNDGWFIDIHRQTRKMKGKWFDNRYS